MKRCDKCQALNTSLMNTRCWNCGNNLIATVNYTTAVVAVVGQKINS